MMNLQERAQKVFEILKKKYPDAKIELTYKNPFQLLIATILSAQCTDAQVNKVTPALFAKFKTPNDFAKASRSTLESMIRSTGFYKNKAASIQKCSQKLVSDFNGKVPSMIDDLTSLPGVGRKTANVVLGGYFGIPGIVVDTHVSRVSQRLALTKNENADKIEFDLQKLFPEKNWIKLSLVLMFHGRRCCYAKKPNCPACPVASLCPSRNKFI
jgi:endonuclease-3